MSKNITTTAAALTKQGVSEGTVTTAVSGITKGMGTVGANTTKSMMKVETVTSVVKGKTTSLPELCRYPWVSLMTGTITRNFLNTYFAERGLPFAPAIELATTDLILPAIEHNLGIGFLPPEFVRGALDMGSVFQIHFPDEMPHRRISLVYDTEYPQSIAATTFRKFMLEHFSQL